MRVEAPGTPTDPPVYRVALSDASAAGQILSVPHGRLCPLSFSGGEWICFSDLRYNLQRQAKDSNVPDLSSAQKLPPLTPHRSPKLGIAIIDKSLNQGQLVPFDEHFSKKTRAAITVREGQYLVNKKTTDDSVQLLLDSAYTILPPQAIPAEKGEYMEFTLKWDSTKFPVEKGRVVPQDGKLRIRRGSACPLIFSEDYKWRCDPMWVEIPHKGPVAALEAVNGGAVFKLYDEVERIPEDAVARFFIRGDVLKETMMKRLSPNGGVAVAFQNTLTFNSNAGKVFQKRDLSANPLIEVQRKSWKVKLRLAGRGAGIFNLFVPIAPDSSIPWIFEVVTPDELGVPPQKKDGTLIRPFDPYSDQGLGIIKIRGDKFEARPLPLPGDLHRLLVVLRPSEEYKTELKGKSRLVFSTSRLVFMKKQTEGGKRQKETELAVLVPQKLTSTGEAAPPQKWAKKKKFGKAPNSDKLEVIHGKPNWDAVISVGAKILRVFAVSFEGPGGKQTTIEMTEDKAHQLQINAKGELELSKSTIMYWLPLSNPESVIVYRHGRNPAFELVRHPKGGLPSGITFAITIGRTSGSFDEMTTKGLFRTQFITINPYNGGSDKFTLAKQKHPVIQQFVDQKPVMFSFHYGTGEGTSAAVDVPVGERCLIRTIFEAEMWECESLSPLATAPKATVAKTIAFNPNGTKLFSVLSIGSKLPKGTVAALDVPLWVVVNVNKHGDVTLEYKPEVSPKLLRTGIVSSPNAPPATFVTLSPANLEKDVKQQHPQESKGMQSALVGLYGELPSKWFSRRKEVLVDSVEVVQGQICMLEFVPKNKGHSYGYVCENFLPLDNLPEGRKCVAIFAHKKRLIVDASNVKKAATAITVICPVSPLELRKKNMIIYLKK